MNGRAAVPIKSPPALADARPKTTAELEERTKFWSMLRLSVVLRAELQYTRPGARPESRDDCHQAGAGRLNGAILELSLNSEPAMVFEVRDHSLRDDAVQSEGRSEWGARTHGGWTPLERQ
jgi:hypothetical protein